MYEFIKATITKELTYIFVQKTLLILNIIFHIHKNILFCLFKQWSMERVEIKIILLSKRYV